MIHVLPYLFGVLAVGLLILALITKGGSGFSPPRLKKQEEYMAKWFWIMAAGFAALAIAV